MRRNGHTQRSKSFLSKRDAEKWARQMEAELDATALAFDPRVLERTTVRDLMGRYRKEVTPSKRGHASENKRLDGFLRQTWADKPLSKATPQVFSRYRDERLRTVSPGTVIRDLGLLRAIFETARLEWDIPLAENPVAKVRKPKAPDARERRLLAGELDRLLTACEANRNEWLRSGILLAVETGMRRGELLSICWADADLDGSLDCYARSGIAILVDEPGQPKLAGSLLRFKLHLLVPHKACGVEHRLAARVSREATLVERKVLLFGEQHKFAELLGYPVHSIRPATLGVVGCSTHRLPSFLSTDKVRRGKIANSPRNFPRGYPQHASPAFPHTPSGHNPVTLDVETVTAQGR